MARGAAGLQKIKLQAFLLRIIYSYEYALILQNKDQLNYVSASEKSKRYRYLEQNEKAKRYKRMCPSSLLRCYNIASHTHKRHSEKPHMELV